MISLFSFSVLVRLSPQLLLIFSLFQSLVRQFKEALLPFITLQFHLFFIFFKGLMTFSWHLGISKVGAGSRGRIGVRGEGGLQGAVRGLWWQSPPGFHCSWPECCGALRSSCLLVVLSAWAQLGMC